MNDVLAYLLGLALVSLMNGQFLGHMDRWRLMTMWII